ncbi:hypothetical protein J7S33_08770 [Saccharothrix algeriensis]|uniref:Uncharacterized protein n=1 Tax=Saccharothrix algeriensis TaxID=173560 RepID=A0A8T8I257_9PSEU|nr:hypothetical protein J7S33_08770 [Saccharothrix algeriensis]
MTPLPSLSTSPAVIAARSRIRAPGADTALCRRSWPTSSCSRVLTTRLFGTSAGTRTNSPSPRSSW